MPLPPTEPRVVASDYYKKYIKSVYEKEPLFDSYVRSLPPREVSLYKSESLSRIKADFGDLVGDKWEQEGEELNLGREAASDRLRRLHASKPKANPIGLPKLYVYHRSTWDRSLY